MHAFYMHACMHVYLYTRVVKGARGGHRPARLAIYLSVHAEVLMPRKTTAAAKIAHAVTERPVKSKRYTQQSVSAKRATRSLLLRVIDVISGGESRALIQDVCGSVDYLNQRKKDLVQDVVDVFEGSQTTVKLACCTHAMRRVCVQIVCKVEGPKHVNFNMLKEERGMQSLSRRMYTDVRNNELVKKRVITTGRPQISAAQQAIIEREWVRHCEPTSEWANRLKRSKKYDPTIEHFTLKRPQGEV